MRYVALLLWLLAPWGISGPRVIVHYDDLMGPDSRGAQSLASWLTRCGAQVDLTTVRKAPADAALVIDCTHKGEAERSPEAPLLIAGWQAVQAYGKKQSAVELQSVGQYSHWTLKGEPDRALAALAESQVTRALPHVRLEPHGLALAWGEVPVEARINRPVRLPLTPYAELQRTHAVAWKIAEEGQTFGTTLPVGFLDDPAVATLYETLIRSLLQLQEEPSLQALPCDPRLPRYLRRAPRSAMRLDEDELARFAAFAEPAGIQQLSSALAQQAVTVSASVQWLEQVAGALVATARTRRMGQIHQLAVRGLLQREVPVRLRACQLAGLLRVPGSNPMLQQRLLDLAEAFSVRVAAAEGLRAFPGAVRLADGLQSQPAITDRLLSSVLLADAAPSRAWQLFADQAGKAGPEQAQAIAATFLALIQRATMYDMRSELKTMEPSDASRLALRQVIKENGLPAEEFGPALQSVASYRATHKQVLARKPERVELAIVHRGDPKLGEAVFFRRESACSSCHAIGGRGRSLGPELSQIGLHRKQMELVQVLVDPAESGGGETIRGRSGVVLFTAATANPDAVRVLPAGSLLYLPKGFAKERERRNLMAADCVDEITQAEFYHLIQFLSLLGMPGTAYSPTTEIVAWRALAASPDAIPAWGVETKLYADETGTVAAKDLRALGFAYVLLQATVECQQAATVFLEISSWGRPGFHSIWVRSADTWLPGDQRLDLPAGKSEIGILVEPRILGRDLRVKLKTDAFVTLLQPR